MGANSPPMALRSLSISRRSSSSEPWLRLASALACPRFAMWQALYAGLSHVRERSHGGGAEEGVGALRRPRVVSGLGAHHLVMNIFFRV